MAARCTTASYGRSTTLRTDSASRSSRGSHRTACFSAGVRSAAGGTGAGLWPGRTAPYTRSEEHTSELQSQSNLVCRLLLGKKKENHSLNSPYQIKNTLYLR